MRIVFRGPKNTAGTPFIFNAVRKMVLASGLPFEKAKVNPNWPRLAYGPAPAKGQQAEREYLDIYLTEPVAADKVPTILFPQIASPTEETRNYAEISQVEPGTVLTLAVKLPEGETDTGNWRWEDGATGSQRQITADHVDQSVGRGH